jgi:hypothetical protein
LIAADIGSGAQQLRRSTVLKIAIGIVIALIAWIPLSLSDPRDIAFQAGILGIIGTLIGGITALVGLVQVVRRALERPPV